MTGTEIVTLCLHFLSCGLNHLFRNIIEIFAKKLPGPLYEGWNFYSGKYLFTSTTDTK